VTRADATELETADGDVVGLHRHDLARLFAIEHCTRLPGDRDRTSHDDRRLSVHARLHDDTGSGTRDTNGLSNRVHCTGW